MSSADEITALIVFNGLNLSGSIVKKISIDILLNN
jgi:hypothetical protein